MCENQKYKEVVLHVGFHKTGTSSIQYTLYNKKNRSIFCKNNLSYVESFFFNNSVPIYSAFCDKPLQYHMNLRKDLRPREIHQKNAQSKSELVKKLNCDDSKLLISGEDISNLTVGNLKNLKSFIKVNCNRPVQIKIIIFVRNPLDLVISTYQTNILGGNNTTKARLSCEFKLTNIYKKLIEKFFVVFGEDNTRVFSFENALSNKCGLIGFFFEKLGVSKNDIKTLTSEVKNKSMSNLATNLNEYINNKEPRMQGQQLNKNRSIHDSLYINCIDGNKFRIEKKIIAGWFDEFGTTLENDLIWLKGRCDIDYTDYKDKLNFYWYRK